MNTMQAPCAVKVARTVLGGGKAGDDIKGLPIAIAGHRPRALRKRAECCR